MKQNSPKFSLSEKAQTILYDHTIASTDSCSIVKDFETLLNVIGQGIHTKGANGFFPMAMLAEINLKLTHPICLTSQRPQQKAFPHINGLYLLLRSTGIVYLKKIGKKKFLSLDSETLKSWHSLNLTEKYFTLLEAWLLHGHEELIGEHSRGIPEHLLDCQTFIRQFNGRKVRRPQQTKDEFLYRPHWYNVALLQMFGFVLIDTNKKKSDRFWLIDKITLTDFGKTMIRLLHDLFEKEHCFIKYNEERGVPFGEFQPTLQHFFPEWKNTLLAVEPEEQKGVFVFKVELGDVWRRIAISGEEDLDQFSYSILEAFDFDNDHLYEFIYKNGKGVSTHVHAPESGEPPCTLDVSIGAIGLNPGDSMMYVFDFGACWQFNLTLEKVDDNSTMETPAILESHGDAPQQYEDNW